jgi:NAD(P)-dependent dehydrogenase (short-subunit alcohol dehydrogenase family)
MPSPVLFVTGAGGGVGRAIAARFAADGYAVAVTGRSHPSVRETVGALEGSGAEALALVCDVSSREDVARTVALTEQRLGPIDVLVNNAGIAESAAFVSMPDEMWDRTIAVNLTGAYNCMRAVVPGMFERRHGRVINVASTAARVGFPYTSAYVASKHGLLGLTRAVAIEAQSRGVTVNAICPGWIDTGMTARAVARIVDRTGRSADEATRTLAEMNPRQRLITPAEVAAVVAYLASPEAAAINGQDVDIP